MAKIALHGPQFAGKTTLAKWLRDTHGYEWINYTDHLKSLGARALQGAGLQVTLDQMQADKAKYRPFYQELGTLLGFDTGAFVEDVLEDAVDYRGPDFDNYVFDNVRTSTQFDMLQKHGFILVRMVIDTQTQQKRGTVTSSDHFIEQPLPHYPGEIIIPGYLATPVQGVLLQAALHHEMAKQW